MRSLIRRTVKASLWVLAGLLVLIAVLGSLLLWCLSAGPIDISFLTPYLEKALANSFSGRSIDIQDTVLAWDTEAHDLGLRAREVTIRDRDGTVVAVLPAVHVKLSLQALLRGTVAPTTVGLEGARITLIRDANGDFRFGIGNKDLSQKAGNVVAGADKPASSGNLLQEVLERLGMVMSDPDPEQPLTYVREVRVTNSALQLDDRKLGVTWQVPKADLALRQAKGGLKGHLNITISRPDSPVQVNAKLAYNLSTARLDLEINVSDLRPSSFASLAPAFKGLSGLDLPLAGGVALSVDLQGALHDLRFQLSSGPGKVSYPRLLAEPLSVSSLKAHGTLDGTVGSLRLDRGVVVFGKGDAAGPSLEISGTAEGLGSDITIKGQATLKKFRIADLQQYWPQGVVDDARTWLTENLISGTVDEGRITIALALPHGGVSQARLDQLDGTLHYHGLEVHYLRPLPPIQGINGSARFNQQGFHIQVEAGAAGGGLKLSGAQVDITGLDARQDAIAIRVGIDAPIQAVLTLLDHPRLDLLSGLGIEPASAGGHTSQTLTLAFSLRGKIDFNDINVQASGSLEDASMQNLLLGRDLDHGHLDVSLDNQGLNLTGTATFADVPLRLSWKEAFTRESEWRSQIHAVVPEIDRDALARFGLDLQDILEGPVAATITAKIGHETRTVVDATVTLGDAALRLPFLGWRKPSGEPGEVQGTVELGTGKDVVLGNFTVAAGTLSTRGSARYNPSSSSLERLELHNLKFDNSHLRTVTVRQADTGVDVRLGEGVLDVHPLLAFDRHEKQDRGEDKAAPPGSEFPGAKPTPRLHLQAPALRRVYFGPDRYVQDVKVTLTHSQAGWEFIDLHGNVPAHLVIADRTDKQTEQTDVPSPKTFSVTYQPTSEATYRLSILADDLGSTLRTLTLFALLRGGRVVVEGHTQAPQPDAPIKATLEVEHFTLHQAPILGRLLAAMSLSGLLHLLNSDGLTFDHLDADFVLEHGVMDITRARAYGGSLGLTAKGELNLKAGTTDLKGTIIPAHGLNILPGKIPLIGGLLMGGKGQGLMAATYDVKGKLSEPEISVNPVAMLTPGFLRGIFGLFNSSGDSALPSQPDPVAEDD